MLSRFDLQERLARFMGSEEAILYSYDLATLPSIIPAFASKKDLILCDEVRRLLGCGPAGCLVPEVWARFRSCCPAAPRPHGALLFH